MTRPSEIYGKPWNEREYIIVLHYYILHRNEPRHHLRDYVKNTADLLGRTPGAVVMRMENYASLDPLENQRRKGLVNQSALGEKVWKEWANQSENLKACAEVLIRDINGKHQPSLFDPEPIRIPRAFGRYELLDPIGEGAFGSVFSCIDPDSQESYAMKIIKTDRISDPEILGRFRREIKALKALSHPNVVAIHEDNLDEQEDFPAFIMDLARCSLSGFLEKELAGKGSGMARPLLSTSQAILILNAVFSAVEALHLNTDPVLHRDINPNNILLMRDDTWVLADFSLSKFMRSAVVTTTFVTMSHKGWGTQTYTAPEQWQDFKKTDQRTDVYSLGVLIWEMLSPTWPPFDRHCLSLPERVEKVVLKATERNRDLRHPSVSALRSELLQALAE
jgi:hypothetical protein